MTRRNIQDHIARRGQEDEFDREFWRNAGHEARFAAAAEMVREMQLMRGKRPEECRMDRSIAMILRRNQNE